ncbi:TonB-dependent receptor plug domain-containing protein [Alteromonas lipolytica]|uniref:TonB-dependent receptor n=1 Tax=Alteromonas lipolytica TaxID=1856405 RepID=A0A1E8F9C0_9ALTE|nr:TonB-dependent receptor [Alteromonas lipolytica]OFI32198.1 TonB-dependent receptor [Alteromonas lipolytica]GGF83078.1 TonB-dependent receptor [Alteromonas lipolytica]
MYQLKHLSHAVKQALLVGSLSVLSMQVYAQESAPDKNADDASIEKIEVTGSRIKRAELTSPAPVLSVDAAEIARFGNPDLGSILAELPAIGASATLIGNNNINENAGLSSPDLRGLGENRTLTLVNGKRHVAGSPFSSAIDTGSIPNALIERIDVITGGASAVYGSDAVSGVINIVLRDDFEGVEFRASGNTDTQGIGNDTYNFGVLVGSNFDDERGNITFYAERSQINEVLIPELQQAANWGSYINPDDTGEDDGIPDRLRAQNVGSEFINRFTVINPFGGGPRLTFTPDGTPFTQVSRNFDNSFAFGTFDQPYESVFFGEDYENYIPDQETTTLASTFRYDITNNVRFYGDIKYIEKDIEQQFQPSFRFGGISFNATDNPYLPEAARAELFANGQTGDVEISRFFDDIGNRSAANDRELFRVIGGFDGYFSLGGTDFDYDVFYTYGETSNTRRTLNDLIPGNLNAALDAVIDPATGNIACRSQVPEAQGEGYEDPSTVNPENCAPFNPFGFGQGSAEAYDFISGDVERKDEIEQTVFGGSLSFDSSAYFELPGGPLAFAVGYEYREEKVSTTTDELTKQGVYTNAATPDSSGSFDVDEFFIEISAPLIKDMFLLQELTLDAAFRSADYSHAGNADAWQLGFMWAPIEDVRIRGTVSEAVRAPNVDEAFSPQSPGFENINDPCDVDNINDDPDRAANCLALGIPAGFEANDNVSIDILSGGNPDLFSETSKSKTVGVVWTPAFIDNFSLTLDWYEIDIQDAINAVDAQDILDNCVDATGGPDQSFCNQIDRNAENNVELVRSGFVNASAIYTSGVEFQLRYQAELAALSLPGEIRLNLQGNKVNDLETFEFQDRPDEINVDVGEVGNPEYQLRTVLDYHLGDWVLNHTSRFIDRVATFDVSPGADTPEDLSPAFIGSIWTHDFAVRYLATDNVEMSVGLRNAFNKIPPGYTFDPLYDLVGRRVNASVVVRFE